MYEKTSFYKTEVINDFSVSLKLQQCFVLMNYETHVWTDMCENGDNYGYDCVSDVWINLPR